MSPNNVRRKDLRQATRDGASGGIGAIALPSEHANPPSEGEKLFFLEIFGIYGTLKTML